jgi:hypothetical protein
MSRLTDVETIKKIIQTDVVILPNVFNERIVLNLYEDSQLGHANVDEDTEVVKRIEVVAPQAEAGNPITLNANVPVNLDNQKIAWDSVVVAADAFAAVVYVENVDYIIDYTNGTVRRANVGSTIPDGGAVWVWTIPFAVMAEGSDYNINYDEGTITRRAGTDIPDGATVWVDYAHSQATVTDLAIRQAIAQSESFIASRLRGGFTMESDDEGLKSACTFFTMYNLCLSQMFKELNARGKENSDDLAKQWEKLAVKYQEIAAIYFSKYLNIPTLQAGGIIKNRWVDNRPSRAAVIPTPPRRTRRY